MLLLLRVFLLQLLGLLLVFLFYLLLPRVIGVLLGEALVFLLLLLLQLLVLLILLLDQLVLLRLILLVQFGVSRVRSRAAFVRLKLRSVARRRPRNVVLRATCVLRTGRWLVATVLRPRNVILRATGCISAAFGWRMIGRARFSG